MTVLMLICEMWTHATLLYTTYYLYTRLFRDMKWLDMKQKLTNDLSTFTETDNKPRYDQIMKTKTQAILHQQYLLKVWFQLFAQHIECYLPLPY